MLHPPVFRTSPTQFSLLLGFLGSGFALGGASLSEYVFSLHPCQLCLYQRDIHWAVVVLSMAGLVALRKDSARRFCSFVLVALLAGSVALALTHVGVEQGFWEEVCTNPAGQGLASAQDLEAFLETSPVSCKQVSWSLFGISLAGYNALYSLFLAGGILRLVWHKQRGSL